jgi:hypothetical protein
MGSDDCVQFTYCDPKSLTCLADPVVGGACGSVTVTSGDEVMTEDITCLGGYCDLSAGDSGMGTCVALLAEGAACTLSEQCQSSTCSTAGVCSAPKCPTI